MSIYNGKFLGFKEGMFGKAESEENASNHPDIALVVDWVLQVLVDHLGRTVHHGSVPLELFHLVGYLFLRAFLVVQSVS